MAPVCIMLGQMFTVRKVMMLGAFIGFLGMSVSCLLFSMEYVIATFGICFGIGNASIYGNCLVILGMYFDKRLSLANGLALSGSSIGQFALPPLIEFLLEQYGLSGCLLMVGGVYFNVVAAASLFRPVSYWASTRKSSSIRSQERVLTLKEKEEENGNNVRLSKTLSNAKEVCFEDEHGSSVTNTVDVSGKTTTTTDSEAGSVQIEMSVLLSRPHSESTDQGSAVDSEKNPETTHSHTISSHHTDGASLGNTNNTTHQDTADTTVPDADHQQTPLMSEHKEPHTTTHRSRIDSNSSHQSSDGKLVADCENPFVEVSLHKETESEKLVGTCSSHKQSCNSLHIQPLYGSTLKIEQLQSPPDKSLQQEGNKKSMAELFHSLMAMFDFSVMKSYVAVLIAVASFLCFFGYFNFVLFLPATVAMRGIVGYDKAVLVSVTGIGDLIGRLTIAAIGDREFIERYKLQALGMFMVGVSIGVMVWAESQVWMMVLCAMYGYFGGIQVSLMAVVIVDFVGMAKMPKLLAVVMLIQGVGASVGQPLLGAVRDATGSFQWVLVITALCCVIASLLLLCYPLVLRLEPRRPAKFALLPPPAQSTLVT
ncbi:uncharacterized protein LOC143275592 isoform X2 [Babylonia areolata]